MDAPDRPRTIPLMTSKTFRERVRAERERQKMSQQDLANRAGLSASTVYRVEGGKDVDRDTEEKLAAALGWEAGRTLSALARVPFTPVETPVEQSAMGQLVGQMQMHGGSRSVDPYAVLTEAAVKRDDPPEVFKALARARAEAPPDADWAWWLTRYIAALTPPRG